MANTGHRISEAALLLGYAMSRLDRRMLELLGCSTLESAFTKAGQLLDENPKSIRLLRDEFDPFFDNTRRGWADRPMRAPLIAILHEMEEVSDAALEAMVVDALGGKATALDAVKKIVTVKPERLANVAERLRTGALAERYFTEHCERLVNVAFPDLHDARLDACGYDFSLGRNRQPVFEVKGLAGKSGGLLFTDLEWQTARRLGSAYWLVVVQHTATDPHALVLTDPTAKLSAQIFTERRTTISWRSQFSAEILTN